MHENVHDFPSWENAASTANITTAIMTNLGQKVECLIKQPSHCWTRSYQEFVHFQSHRCHNNCLLKQDFYPKFQNLWPPFWAAARRDRWPMLSHIWGIFSFSFSIPPSNPNFKAQIPASRPKSQSWGPNPCLEAQIPVLRPKSQPQGPNPSLKAQISASRPKFQSWSPNLSLNVKISAKRPRSWPWGPNLSLSVIKV